MNDNKIPQSKAYWTETNDGNLKFWLIAFISTWAVIWLLWDDVSKHFSDSMEDEAIQLGMLSPGTAAHYGKLEAMLINGIPEELPYE